MKKICTKCGVEKELSLDNFYADKRNSKGFKRWCKPCHNDCVSARAKETREAVNERRRKWRKNPEVKLKEAIASKIRSQSPEQKEKMKKWQKEWRSKNPLRWMMQVAKARAKKDGCPFDEDTSDVFIPEICPILGIPLFVKGEIAGPNSPSLDKIIPELGYIKGNRWVISYRANAMKNDANLDEIILLGKWAQGEKERRG